MSHLRMGSRRPHVVESAPCECEHACHHADTGAVSPNGNPGHRYGAKFVVGKLVTVRTDGQTERVCPDCAADCRQNGERL